MPVRDMVHINEEKCNGCGECIPHCAEGALQIVNGKVKLIRDEYCDGLGACLGHCPQNAITVSKREAAAFDEELVKGHLAAGSRLEVEACEATCPGTHMVSIEQFGQMLSPSQEDPTGSLPRSSMLRQWPVQLHLVPPNAPYFRNAELLVTADCVPLAYPEFHEDLLKGRAVVMSCPKLDNIDAHLAKLTEIFRQSSPKSVVIAHMEVPCCFRLVSLVQRAARQAKLNAPMKDTVVNVDGTVRQ